MAMMQARRSKARSSHLSRRYAGFVAPRHGTVHPADIQDRDGCILLLATLFGMYPFLKKLFADGVYQGPDFQKALAKDPASPHNWKSSSVSDHAKGFVVLPRRWVASSAPLLGSTAAEGFVKDWENLNRTALAFPTLSPQSASMLRKLCNPA